MANLSLDVLANVGQTVADESVMETIPCLLPTAAVEHGTWFYFRCPVFLGFNYAAHIWYCGQQLRRLALFTCVEGNRFRESRFYSLKQGRLVAGAVEWFDRDLCIRTARSVR